MNKARMLLRQIERVTATDLDDDDLYDDLEGEDADEKRVGNKKGALSKKNKSRNRKGQLRALAAKGFIDNDDDGNVIFDKDGDTKGIKAFKKIKKARKDVVAVGKRDILT